MTDKLIKRAVLALERIAEAQEATAAVLSILIEQAAAEVPQKKTNVIMTQAGPVELR
jgi:hypothetical protein